MFTNVECAGRNKKLEGPKRKGGLFLECYSIQMLLQYSWSIIVANRVHEKKAMILNRWLICAYFPLKVYFSWDSVLFDSHNCNLVFLSPIYKQPAVVFLFLFFFFNNTKAWKKCQRNSAPKLRTTMFIIWVKGSLENWKQQNTVVQCRLVWMWCDALVACFLELAPRSLVGKCLSPFRLL